MRFAAGILDFVEDSQAYFPEDAQGLSLEELRSCYDRLCDAYAQPVPFDLDVESLMLGERVPARLYRPADSHEQLPVMIYFHGGGWVFGSPDSHESVTARLARELQCAVISVDYRLAPEFGYPSQLEDALIAIHDVRERGFEYQVDADVMVLAGDSAGGWLALSACLALRKNEQPQPRGQVLIYPAVGLSLLNPDLPIEEELPGLTKEEMSFYLEAFLGKEPDVKDELVVPLAAEDFKGIAPTFVHAAEHDILADDAEVLVSRLLRDEVQARLHVGRGLVHGHLRATGVCAEAERSFQAIVEGCREVFQSSEA